MIITDLEIDGFGVWSALPLEALSDRLNVVYGPNEAGKTTLMQFVRYVLFGPSEERRRYLPPLRGGTPGGTIGLRTANGAFRLSRRGSPSGGPGGLDSATLSGTSGVALSGERVAALLGGIDEAVYSNVFAVGLQEMQELGALSDTQAAAMLYDLTTGVDRVSLSDVMRELAAAREGLLGHGGQSGEAARLLADRRRLLAELDEVGVRGRDYWRLAGDRDRLGDEIKRLEAERAELEHEVKAIETATLVREKWERRAMLDRQLSEIDRQGSLPPRAIERLDAWNRRIRKGRKRLAALTRRRRRLKAETRGLRINRALWRQAPRVAALADQQDWLLALEKQVTELDAQLASLETGLSAERRALGLPAEMPSAGPKPRRHRSGQASTLEALRPLAIALRDGRRLLTSARQEIHLNQKATAELADRERRSRGHLADADLSAEMERAGTLVSQLRRRVELERRLEQMARQETELEERGEKLVERQLLPIWVLSLLGGLFVLGVVLILAAFFLPQSLVGSFGWAMAVLGLGGTISAVLGKFVLERDAEKQLETCRRQLDMLRQQARQAHEELAQLDKQLPVGGGPITVRLEAAQGRLAELEELLPLEARKKIAAHDADAARTRAREARRLLIEARRRWSQALCAAGWPGEWSPRQLRLAVRGSRRLRELERRLARCRRERDRVEQSRRNLSERVGQLIADAGLTRCDDQASEQVRRLRQELVRQDELVARRNGLAEQSRRLRRRKSRLLRQLHRCCKRRRGLLRAAHVADQAELRRVAARADEIARNHADRETLDREIAAVLAGQVTPEEIERQIAPGQVETLERRWEEAGVRLQACEGALRERFERKGGLNQQLASLVADGRPAATELELAVVEERLHVAVERWRVLAVTGLVLDSVRQSYERDRQPQTLREASHYLDRLTCGKYTRVWTPWDEDVLYVDTPQRETLAVEALSRGTREQLFLSIRLALVDAFARRGAALPLVLDDVFVNFDAERTKAAVDLLIEFAEAGRQVFVFTCHEHIARLFKARKVNVRELPSHAPRRIDPPEQMPPPAKKRSRKSPARKSTSVPPASSEADEPLTGPHAQPAYGLSQEAAQESLPAPAYATEASSPRVPIAGPPRADPPVTAFEYGLADADVAQRPAAQSPSPPRFPHGFLGPGGAEEFAGEFAERPAHDHHRPAISHGDARPDDQDWADELFEGIWLRIDDEADEAGWPAERQDDAAAA